MVAMLGLGFYTVYGGRRAVTGAGEACAPGEACAVPRSRTRDKVLLWATTALALALWTFPSWAGVVV